MKNKINFLISTPWFPKFDNEEPEEVKLLQQVLEMEGLKPELKEALENKLVPSLKSKRLSQDEVDKIMAATNKKYKTQIDKTIEELEKHKKSSQLTEQEKEQLQHRIEELQASVMTAEEKATKEKEKLQNEHKLQLETKDKEALMWKTLYSTESITNQILESSRKYKAYSDEQMKELLLPKTNIYEVLDEQTGKPIPGRYVAKTKFKTIEDGKEKELVLTIDETIKMMRDNPERFGNLFESDSVGGLGGNRTPGQVGSRYNDPNKPPTDHAEYVKWRKEQKIGRVNQSQRAG